LYSTRQYPHLYSTRQYPHLYSTRQYPHFYSTRYSSPACCAPSGIALVAWEHSEYPREHSEYPREYYEHPREVLPLRGQARSCRRWGCSSALPTAAARRRSSRAPSRSGRPEVRSRTPGGVLLEYPVSTLWSTHPSTPRVPLTCASECLPSTPRVPLVGACSSGHTHEMTLHNGGVELCSHVTLQRRITLYTTYVYIHIYI
jgi:hypothetical protein